MNNTQIYESQTQEDLKTQTALRAMSADTIDTHLLGLVAQERQSMHQVLFTIKEMMRRHLYAELGCDSIFAYLTKRAKYSESAAQRRIVAARLLAEIPEISEAIKSGALNLSQTGVVQKVVRAKQERENVKVTTAAKKEILENVCHMTLQQTEHETAAFFETPIPTHLKTTPQADGSIVFEVRLTAEQNRVFEVAKGLVSHSVDPKDHAAFIEFVSRQILKAKTGTPRLLEEEHRVH